MAGIYRVLAVLRLSYQIALLITQVKAIMQAMTGNTFFPTPNPMLAVILTHLSELHEAEAAAKRKTTGAAAARDVKKNVVRSDMQLLRAYVQSIADSMPSMAEQVIKSAGMGVRRVNPRQKNTFTATQGDISGVVELTAAVAALAACYQWEWSSDLHTWTSLTPTIQANTTVSGLTPATTYYFRYRAVTRAGQGDWGQIIALLVK
jgi:hypothetical protein